jgi:hypothetical protein
VELIRWIRLQWDRVGAVAAVAAGMLALLLGWLGTSSTAFPAEQIPYIVSGGLFGLFLLGLGGMLWLSADVRDEWRKLDDLEQAVREVSGAVPSGQDAAAGAGGLYEQTVPSQSGRPKASTRVRTSTPAGD